MTLVKRPQDDEPRFIDDAEGPDMRSVPSPSPDEQHRRPVLAVIDAYEGLRRRRESAIYGNESRYKAPRLASEELEKKKGNESYPHFEKLSKVLETAGVPAITYLSRRFAMQPTTIVYPNQLLKHLDMEGVALVRYLAASSIVKECLTASLATQRQIARTQMSVSPSPDHVILDSFLQLTPLFRFIMAVSIRRDKIALRFIDAAREQYRTASADYDVAWREVLTKPVMEFLLRG